MHDSKPEVANPLPPHARSRQREHEPHDDKRYIRCVQEHNGVSANGVEVHGEGDPALTQIIPTASQVFELRRDGTRQLHFRRRDATGLNDQDVLLRDRYDTEITHICMCWPRFDERVELGEEMIGVVASEEVLGIETKLA